MTNTQSSKSKEAAKKLIEKFGFKVKLDEIINEKDESLIPILTSNLAIFGVTSTILFNKVETELSAPILLILISAIISLIGALLNIWYLVRIKTRIDFLKKEQEEVYKKAEVSIIKMFDLLYKIVKINIVQKIEIPKENTESKDDFIKKIKDDHKLDSFAEELVFIPQIVLELALKESHSNFSKCLNAPLEEKFSKFKLFIDRLSDKSKNWALILSASFTLVALLIKFVIG
jgi:hypothetical protein